nr:uncharacterized protein LOC113805909 [Penaeus vannamei]
MTSQETRDDAPPSSGPIALRYTYPFAPNLAPFLVLQSCRFDIHCEKHEKCCEEPCLTHKQHHLRLTFMLLPLAMLATARTLEAYKMPVSCLHQQFILQLPVDTTRSDSTRCCAFASLSFLLPASWQPWRATSALVTARLLPRLTCAVIPRLPPAAPTPLPATTSSTATSPTATTMTSVHRTRNAAQTAVPKGKSVCPSESCPSECMAHDELWTDC